MFLITGIVDFLVLVEERGQRRVDPWTQRTHHTRMRHDFVNNRGDVSSSSSPSSFPGIRNAFIIIGLAIAFNAITNMNQFE